MRIIYCCIIAFYNMVRDAILEYRKRERVFKMIRDNTITPSKFCVEEINKKIWDED